MGKIFVVSRNDGIQKLQVIRFPTTCKKAEEVEIVELVESYDILYTIIFLNTYKALNHIFLNMDYWSRNSGETRKEKH
jgi:hypothetical protein